MIALEERQVPMRSKEDANDFSIDISKEPRYYSFSYRG